MGDPFISHSCRFKVIVVLKETQLHLSKTPLKTCGNDDLINGYVFPACSKRGSRNHGLLKEK